MSRFFIESIKCDATEGGFVCGPVSGPVVTEVKVIKDGTETFYMSLAEVDGCPNFFITSESTYEMQVTGDMSDEQIESLNDCCISTDDYEEIFETEDSEWLPLYKYLIYIVRTNREDCKAFIAESTGKYIDEIDVPMSDIEEEYLEEFEE